LQISTDEVYGSLGPIGYFTEKTKLDPHSPYSSSKASADLITKAYHDTYGLNVNITRCSNNYGPYQFPEKLIPLMIQNALQHKQLPIYGDGKQIRDWLYVEDHCRALDVVIHQGKPGETYNIGGNNEVKNLDLVKLICAIMDELAPELPVSPSSNLITFVKDRPGHDRRYAINAGKIKQELGWQPQQTLEKGLRSTIEWYLNNRDWWQPLLSEEYQNYYSLVYQSYNRSQESPSQ